MSININKILTDIIAEETKGKTTSESLLKATKETKKKINKYLNDAIEVIEETHSKEKQKERAEKFHSLAKKAGSTAYSAPKGIGRGFAALVKPFKEGWEDEMKK